MTPVRASWRVAKTTAAPLPSEIEGLIEEGTEALPVRITIVQDGVRTGWDDGALGFEDDAVWFSGRACSFQIVAPDVLPLAYGPAMDAAGVSEQDIPLRHSSRQVVKVALLTSEGLIEAEGTGEGESQYPPLTPRPGVLSMPPPGRNELFRYALPALAVSTFSMWRGRFEMLVVISILWGPGLYQRCLKMFTRQRAVRRIAAEEAASLPPP